MTSASALTRVLARITARDSTGEVAGRLAGVGVPVFPCVPGGKRPLTAHGFHDATTDPGRVVAWWREHPTANLAVPTGAASGLVVVDVDVHGLVDGYRAFERAERAGLVSGWQLVVATPSGGMHAYYRAPPDRVQRSWQAARSGIDFRGDGGYIVVPPSTLPTNDGSGGYRVRRVVAGACSELDADRLREFLDPRPAPTRRPDPGAERSVEVSRLAAWVAARQEGERNRGLFWAACRLAENNIAAADALDVLTAPAAQAGLGEREITATVRSAYRTVHPPPQTSSRSYDVSSQSMVGWFSRDASVRSPSVRGLS
ncbi:MAG: bifunctional DNA primase/polymerase [Actinobacteria bacterium]|nr:bifunctional DNA primase/polymerase [Actinomycetota bacterium]